MTTVPDVYSMMNAAFSGICPAFIVVLIIVAGLWLVVKVNRAIYRSLDDMRYSEPAKTKNDWQTGQSTEKPKRGWWLGDDGELIPYDEDDRSAPEWDKIKRFQ